jgi:hypothetical protein
VCDGEATTSHFRAHTCSLHRTVRQDTHTHSVFPTPSPVPTDPSSLHLTSNTPISRCGTSPSSKCSQANGTVAVVSGSLPLGSCSESVFVFVERRIGCEAFPFPFPFPLGLELGLEWGWANLPCVGLSADGIAISNESCTSDACFSPDPVPDPSDLLLLLLLPLCDCAGSRVLSGTLSCARPSPCCDGDRVCNCDCASSADAVWASGVRGRPHIREMKPRRWFGISSGAVWVASDGAEWAVGNFVTDTGYESSLDLGFIRVENKRCAHIYVLPLLSSGCRNPIFGCSH